MTMTYTKLVVFGDGLSDQGRFGALTQNRYPPSPPFAGGRWTNGPTWVEVMAQRLSIPLDAADNWAQGGATTGYYNINEPLRALLGLPADAPIRGVLTQIDAFLASPQAVNPEALYVVWAGGHDFGSYLDYGQPDLFTNPPAANIRLAVTRLAEAGARHFFIGNMPDLANTPAYSGTDKAAVARELVADYNEGLQETAAELRQTHNSHIVEFDAASIFQEVAMNPAAFGVRYVTKAYLPLDYIDFSSPLAEAKPLPDDRLGHDADEYMSFWAVAAGRKVHALLGERAAAALGSQQG